MYTAIESISNKKIMADDAVKSSIYKCEKCNAIVFLKRGLVREAHFAHGVGSNCDYFGETQLHLSIKKDIFKSLFSELNGRVKIIEIEKHLGIVRPDIYIEGYKRKIAIEIQASHLTPEQILYRTEKYYKLGIYVIWVLPFEKDRFLKENSYLGNCWLGVKLKEYERIILYMYFRTLYFWDISHYSSDKFIAIEFGDEWTDSTEFYDINYQQIRHFDPKKLKTIKVPRRAKINLSVTNFEYIKAKEFSMPMAGYTLPNRYIANYNWKKNS